MHTNIFGKNWKNVYCGKNESKEYKRQNIMPNICYSLYPEITY